MKRIKEYCDTCSKLSVFPYGETEPFICRHCERSYRETGSYFSTKNKSMNENDRFEKLIYRQRARVLCGGYALAVDESGEIR